MDGGSKGQGGNSCSPCASQTRPWEATRPPPLDKPLETLALGGVPSRARTCDPRFRKPVLYPAELPGHALFASTVRADAGCSRRRKANSMAFARARFARLLRLAVRRRFAALRAGSVSSRRPSAAADDRAGAADRRGDRAARHCPRGRARARLAGLDAPRPGALATSTASGARARAAPAEANADRVAGRRRPTAGAAGSPTSRRRPGDSPGRRLLRAASRASGRNSRRAAARRSGCRSSGRRAARLGVWARPGLPYCRLSDVCDASPTADGQFVVVEGRVRRVGGRSRSLS